MSRVKKRKEKRCGGRDSLSINRKESAAEGELAGGWLLLREERPMAVWEMRGSLQELLLCRLNSSLL